MFKINKEDNSILKLEKESFSSLGFKEREHLQEWIAKNPSSLGEDLLIIQKEFADFSDTNERLDLLALDKQGNLVVIENKLDDSGKDVTWQALKYASYCSSLNKENVKDIYKKYLKNELGNDEDNVEELLSDFLDQDFDEANINQGATQRMILVAANFRKEVTSTVLWLASFGIRIQCFKTTPYSFGDELLLNIEQILPVIKEDDYAISMASKIKDEIATQATQKNRDNIRTNFWKQFITASNNRNNIFQKVSPSRDAWIGTGMGMTGITLNVVVTKSHCRAEIYFNRGDKELNKKLFDFLITMKDSIESDLRFPLKWERKDDKVVPVIKHVLSDVSIDNKEDWDKMITFLQESSEKMHAAFLKPIQKMNAYSKKLTSKAPEEDL